MQSLPGAFCSMHRRFKRSVETELRRQQEDGPILFHGLESRGYALPPYDPPHSQEQFAYALFPSLHYSPSPANDKPVVMPCEPFRYGQGGAAPWINAVVFFVWLRLDSFWVLHPGLYEGWRNSKASTRHRKSLTQTKRNHMSLRGFGNLKANGGKTNEIL
jgi:hypothetical protein